MMGTLTLAQRRIVSMLYAANGEVVRFRDMHPTRTCLQVLISQARKALPSGVRVECLQGLGYRMAIHGDAREPLLELLNREPRGK